MSLVRRLTVLTKSFVIAAAGCAAAPPPAPTGGSLPVKPPPARPTFDTPLAARGISGGDELAGLCDRLAEDPQDGLGGNEVKRELLRSAKRVQREESAAGFYVAEIPPAAFSFRYDLADQRLIVDTKSFAVAPGAEIYGVDPDRNLTFAIAPDAAERLAGAHADGRAALRLLFHPAPSAVRNDPCLRLGGGIVKVSAALLAGAIVDGAGKTLARAETEDYREALAAHVAVRAPEVVVGRPTSDDRREPPREVTTSAAALGGKLLGCYQQALGAQPRLRGTLVVGARLAADGRLEGPRVEVDAVKDEKLAACVLDRLGKTRLAATGGSMQLSLPIELRSADER